MTTTSRAAPGVCDQTSGEAWQCAARRQALPEPADCNWPDCGCDPHATKVIEALLEQGWSGPRVPQPNLLGRETVREALEEIVSWKHDTLGPRPAPADYDQKATENFDRGARMAFYRCADRAARALAALQPSKE